VGGVVIVVKGGGQKAFRRSPMFTGNKFPWPCIGVYWVTISGRCGATWVTSSMWRDGPTTLLWEPERDTPGMVDQ
jgi:hypothetical protein